LILGPLEVFLIDGVLLGIKKTMQKALMRLAAFLNAGSIGLLQVLFMHAAFISLPAVRTKYSMTSLLRGFFLGW
jgi:hypothetical protein